MRKVENIALIQFPVNNIGGIVTWNKEIQVGLRNIGVQPMFFHATPGNKMGTDPDKDIRKKRFTQLAGYHLSYSDKNLKESIDILNQFDAVMFTKISPHPTKANLNAAGIENWVSLYKDVKVPKVVIFHDAMWKETNSWCDMVADDIDICVAAQKKFMASVETYPSKCVKYWDYFPMDFTAINKLDLTKKEKYGILATQWIKWKNHHKFIPQLLDLKVPMYIFGEGIEWYYINKTEEYLTAINKDYNACIAPGVPLVRNPKAIHTNMGHVLYSELQKYYSKALFSIDLSTRGYTNYTHFEPLAYRAISMIECNVANDPNNVIPEDCCMTYDLPNAAEQLNSLLNLDQKLINKTLDNGQKFIQRFDCNEVAQRIITAIQKL